MKALVTSGGTKVPIDDVRYIANFSKGNFGAKLAHVLVRKAVKKSGFVHHLRCKDAPDCCSMFNYYSKYSSKYNDTTFWSYDDYLTKIKYLIQEIDFDVVFLAAAVSDYTLSPIQGKMASDKEVTLTLTPTVKIIKELRNWAASEHRKRFIQVGFKLVSGDTTIDDMLEIAARANISNDSDFTIANHMENLNRKYIVRRLDNAIRSYDITDLPEALIDFIMEGK